MSERAHKALLLTLSIVLTAGWYWPATGFELINYDDDRLVLENAPIARGLGVDTLRWAFTTTHFKTWQPLVWLSYLADASVSGLDPRGFHRTNVLLHAVNVALVFAFLAHATRRPRASALAAAVFALHPLQVESVAWIAERKGLLAATFSLVAVNRYVRSGAGAGVHISMALALMSKGTAVVVPLLLLALDVWPLRRVSRASLPGLLLEKKWLFVLALVSGVWTAAVFGKGGALPGLDRVSLEQRLSNTMLSPLVYARKFVWPADLRIPYRHAPPADPVTLTLAAVAFAAAGVLAWRARREHPHVAAGLAWFLAALSPVIGLVPAGHHWIADRYAYVPLIGLSALVAFTAADLARPRLTGGATAALALALVVALGLVTRVQLARWRSSATLFAHTLDLDPANVTAHSYLGRALASAGKLQPAIEHFWRAVELEPATPRHHYDLGVVLMMAGRNEEAARVFRETFKLTPGDATVAYNLGYCLAATGRTQEAIAAYEQAAALDPTDPHIHANLGAAYHAAGQLERARTEYRRALDRAPDHAVARKNLAALERAAGR